MMAFQKVMESSSRREKGRVERLLQSVLLQPDGLKGGLDTSVTVRVGVDDVSRITGLNDTSTGRTSDVGSVGLKTRSRSVRTATPRKGVITGAARLDSR
jgi:hypothetical protein